ncbi:hypothetical protein CKM354_000869000 [Cercospora kikuchii]|uniref:DUF6590 domain-containing protein n=1 Tax=Cercospora kikuchii TaxID=84275 RepID=A0A9P3FFH9_9PEZI|nr:uncharacterized protein CKM354_000869000 [Cercospora kikuchii]GIZ45528.1 hypothetical protein CKM354_000869000 [Cercospora kikuchii]
MTSDSATQDLQRLLQRQGWQDLVEMMVAIVKHGLPLTGDPATSAHAAAVRSDRLLMTQHATRHLIEILQETTLNNNGQVVTRQIDKAFGDDLGRVIELMESLRERAQRVARQDQPRDSGTFVVSMSNDVQANASFHDHHQNASLRIDRTNVPMVHSNLVAATSWRPHTAPTTPEVGRPRSICAATSTRPSSPRAPLSPTSPPSAPPYSQVQQFSAAQSGTNGSPSGHTRSSSFHRVRSSTIAYPEASSSRDAGAPHAPVAGPIPDIANLSAESYLHSAFKLRSPKFFKVGRVLTILWSEPQGNDKHSNASNHSECSYVVAYGELAQVKIRRFIIFAQLAQHSLAVPILTYRGRGVENKGDNKADHGIVYTGLTAPQPFPKELPQQQGERGMVPIAIRVTPDDLTVKLAAASRINYAKIYTIEHNVKARAVGMVHDSSLEHFQQQRNEVLTRAYPTVANNT